MSPRVALVTGAAAGLAKGICVALARDGYRIVFTYRPNGTPPDNTLAAVRPYDADAVAIPAEFLSTGAAAQTVEEATRLRGPVEVLVHAVGPIVVRSFARSAPEDYPAMVEGNLGSSVGLAFAVLPGMRERRFGRLVFFGMNGSHVTQPAPKMALYAAAKAGVVAFARTLAVEEAPNGITVNIIEPGDIRDKDADRTHARTMTAGNPTGHPGSWEDIASAVRFAVADAAFYCNGMVLGINGGLSGPHE